MLVLVAAEPGMNGAFSKSNEDEKSANGNITKFGKSNRRSTRMKKRGGYYHILKSYDNDILLRPAIQILQRL